MEWFNQKTSIAGIQVSNWMIALGAIIVILLAYSFMRSLGPIQNRPLRFSNPATGLETGLSFPKIPSGADSRFEAESAHHPARCSHSFSCLGILAPTCSSRGAGLKSRTSFSGISSILL
jgi:hypothetical protein